MKRSPLTRRTEIKRTPMPPRKTRMRQVNPKTAAIRRQARDPRTQYVAEHFTCQVCNKRKATECHELVTRAKNAKSILYRCCYLALCSTCHRDVVSDYSICPLTKALAYKLVGDPMNFDLATINVLRGNSTTEFTMADVAKHLTVL